MDEFAQLITLVDTRIKNNIKEGDYLRLMFLLSKIYTLKVPEDYNSDDPEGTNDIY
jgi:hypothetical protein